MLKAQKGVKREIQGIQQAIPQAHPTESVQPSAQPAHPESNAIKPSSANGWEALGFQYLLSRDAVSATHAFSEAEKIWPDYHNVAEIRQLLIKSKEALGPNESAKWKEFYNKLLRDFSWGMAPDVRQKMRDYITK